MIILQTRIKISMARKVFLACMFLRRLVGKGAVAVFKRGGFNWELDLREGIDFAIFLLGAFERDTVKAYRKLIPEGAIILDIGANIGAHTLHLAKAAGPSGHVFAFEPTSYCFDKLLKNISLNPEIADRISSNRMLLVDETDNPHDNEIYSSWPLVVAKGTHPIHCGQLKDASLADIIRLDDFIKASRVTKVDLIKLDVDGNECKVLRGATETLQRFKPIIVLELVTYLHDETSNDSARQLINILRSAGYELRNLTTNRKLPDHIPHIFDMIPADSSMNILTIKNG